MNIFREIFFLNTKYGIVTIEHIYTLYFRQRICMSSSQTLLPTQFRVLFGPDFCTKHTYSHTLLDILLDSCGCSSRENLVRSFVCTHHDNTEFRYQKFPTTCFLHQSYRCVDVNGISVCVCCLTRICLHQRADTKTRQIYLYEGTLF